MLNADEWRALKTAYTWDAPFENNMPTSVVAGDSQCNQTSYIIHKCAKKKCGIEWMQNSTLYTSVDREMGKSNNVHLYNSSFIHSISVVVSLCSNQFGVLWHSEWFPCPLAWVNYRSSAHDSHRNIIIDTPMVVVVVAQVETVEHDDCVDTFDSANHSAMTIMSSHMHNAHATLPQLAQQVLKSYIKYSETLVDERWMGNCVIAVRSRIHRMNMHHIEWHWLVSGVRSIYLRPHALSMRVTHDRRNVIIPTEWTRNY